MKTTACNGLRKFRNLGNVLLCPLHLRAFISHYPMHLKYLAKHIIAGLFISSQPVLF